MSAKRQRSSDGTITATFAIEYSQDLLHMRIKRVQVSIKFMASDNPTLLDLVRCLPERAIKRLGSPEILTDINMPILDGDSFSIHTWAQEHQDIKARFMRDIAVHDLAIVETASAECERRKEMANKSRENLKKSIAKFDALLEK